MASILGSHLDLPGIGEFRVVRQQRGFVARGQVPTDGTPAMIEGQPCVFVTLEMVSPVERARRN